MLTVVNNDTTDDQRARVVQGEALRGCIDDVNILKYGQLMMAFSNESRTDNVPEIWILSYPSGELGMTRLR